MINDILDFSKVEAGKIDIVPEKYQVLSLVNDMYEIIKARNNGKLELILNVDEEMPSVLYGDVVRLKQVMINFCTNAIKYTDQGSVTVSISMEHQEEKSVLLFSVKDTGIGIKQEDIAKLFKNYGQVDQTVNHHKEGTGLGLAISKQLIDLMDGKVSVESEYGKGSTFSFKVPQKYDLIFMDYFMPGIDGAETTRQVRADEENLNKEVPIIALTADAMSGVREKLLEQGMNDFLSKPIEIKHAYQALYEWLPKDKIRES